MADYFSTWWKFWRNNIKYSYEYAERLQKLPPKKSTVFFLPKKHSFVSQIFWSQNNYAVKVEINYRSYVTLLDRLCYYGNLFVSFSSCKRWLNPCRLQSLEQVVDAETVAKTHHKYNVYKEFSDRRQNVISARRAFLPLGLSYLRSCTIVFTETSPISPLLFSLFIYFVLLYP